MITYYSDAQILDSLVILLESKLADYEDYKKHIYLGNLSILEAVFTQPGSKKIELLCADPDYQPTPKECLARANLIINTHIDVLLRAGYRTTTRDSFGNASTYDIRPLIEQLLMGLSSLSFEVDVKKGRKKDSLFITKKIQEIIDIYRENFLNTKEYVTQYYEAKKAELENQYAEVDTLIHNIENDESYPEWVRLKFAVYNKTCELREAKEKIIDPTGKEFVKYQNFKPIYRERFITVKPAAEIRKLKGELQALNLSLTQAEKIQKEPINELEYLYNSAFEKRRPHVNTKYTIKAELDTVEKILAGQKPLAYHKLLEDKIIPKPDFSSISTSEKFTADASSTSGSSSTTAAGYESDPNMGSTSTTVVTASTVYAHEGLSSASTTSSTSTTGMPEAITPGNEEKVTLEENPDTAGQETTLVSPDLSTAEGLASSLQENILNAAESSSLEDVPSFVSSSSEKPIILSVASADACMFAPKREVSDSRAVEMIAVDNQAAKEQAHFQSLQQEEAKRKQAEAEADHLRGIYDISRWEKKTEEIKFPAVPQHDPFAQAVRVLAPGARR